MSRNKERDDIIADRRRKVAALLVRQWTQREIVKALAAQQDVNHETGEPWDLATIHRDIKALRQMWREEALQDISLHQAQRLMEFAEVKRRGWIDGDMNVVLRAMKQEAEMFGFDAPQKIAPTDPSGTKEYQSLTDEERAAKILAILERARQRQSHGEIAR